MTEKQTKKQHSGIFSRLKSRLQNNRLGDLLVQDGRLSADQLRKALTFSQMNGQQLGQVLVSENLVSRSVIRRTLFEQF